MKRTKEMITYYDHRNYDIYQLIYSGKSHYDTIRSTRLNSRLLIYPKAS